MRRAWMNNVAAAGYVVALSLTLVLRAPKGLLDTIDLGIIVLGTAIVVANILRRPKPLAGDARPWVIAIVAVSMAVFLLYQPPTEIGLSAYLALFLLHVLGDTTAVYLGRSFAIAPALHAVRTGWLYRFVRHPLYSLYIVGDSLYVLCMSTLHNAVVAVVSVSLLMIRAELEERVLRTDACYRNYALRTPWRFIPGVLILG